MSTVALPEPARSRPGRLLRTLSDERLVARIRSGDEAAFEVVYDRYHRDLLSFCRHMLGSRDEAEDALQHVCISAYRALQRDDRPIQLKAWLFAIARNRCLTMLRARREHADIDDVQPSVEGLASEVQRREDLREMLADLQRLPEDQRAALVLSELGAHTHEEVAMILGVRREKVKALVFQAREQLIGARNARDTDCAVIREQLATLRGGALRRTELRRHVDTCPGCAEFKQEVQRQRAAMAVMLPVIPGAALKGSVLSAVFAGGAGGSGGAAVAGGGAVAVGGGAGAALTGGGGMFAGLGAQGLAAKALAVLAVAGAGGTGYVAVEELRADPAPPVTAAPAVAPVEAPTTSGTRPASGPASTNADPSAVTATDKAKGRARRGAGAPGRSGKGASANGTASNGTGSAASTAAGGNAGGSATATAKGRGKPSGPGATRRSSKATTKKSTSRSRRSAKQRRTTAVKVKPKAKATRPATPPKSSKPAAPPGQRAKDPKTSSAPGSSDQSAGSGQGSGNGGDAAPTP